jgi:hypothetical protein
MSKHRNRPWTVTAHEHIEKLDDNLWTVAGNVPGVPIKRRMAIVKRSDGTLLFYHAIPLREDVLAEVLAWGKPAVVVIAHDNHGIDAHAFRGRLGVKLYGPKVNLDKMRAKFDVDGMFEDIPPDPAVSVESIRGTKFGEPVVTVRSGNGARVSLVFSDAFQNNRSDDMMLPFRLLGFGGGPKVAPVFKFLFVTDKAALRAEYEKWAAIPNLTRLIPCHGDIVHNDAAATLRRVAATL